MGERRAKPRHPFGRDASACRHCKANAGTYHVIICVSPARHTVPAVGFVMGGATESRRSLMWSGFANDGTTATSASRRGVVRMVELLTKGYARWVLYGLVVVGGVVYEREVGVVDTGEDQARGQLYTIEMNLNSLRSQSYSYSGSRRRRDRNRDSFSQLTEGLHADEGGAKIIVLCGLTDILVSHQAR